MYPQVRGTQGLCMKNKAGGKKGSTRERWVGTKGKPGQHSGIPVNRMSRLLDGLGRSISSAPPGEKAAPNASGWSCLQVIARWAHSLAPSKSFPAAPTAQRGTPLRQDGGSPGVACPAMRLAGAGDRRDATNSSIIDAIGLPCATSVGHDVELLRDMNPKFQHGNPKGNVTSCPHSRASGREHEAERRAMFSRCRQCHVVMQRCPLRLSRDWPAGTQRVEQKLIRAFATEIEDRAAAHSI